MQDRNCATDWNWDMAAINDPTARRLGARTSSRLAAEIVNDAGYATGVEVKDISSSGARIEFGWGCEVPQRFVLKIKRGNVERIVETVWRTTRDAGLRFVDHAEPAAIPAVAAPPPPPAARISVADLRKIARR